MNPSPSLLAYIAALIIGVPVLFGEFKEWRDRRRCPYCGSKHLLKNDKVIICLNPGCRREIMRKIKEKVLDR